MKRLPGNPTNTIARMCAWRGSEGILAYSTLFNVTVVYLQDAFAIQYSDNGSNKRTQEEAIVFHWFEYISNCEGNVQDYLTPSPCQLHAKPYIMFALCCDLYLNSGQLRNGSFCLSLK